LVLLHSPDGSDILVDTRHITVVRPTDSKHVAEGSHSVVYTIDENFAVREDETEIILKIEACGKER
jgi:hypothetical protein